LLRSGLMRTCSDIVFHDRYVAAFRSDIIQDLVELVMIIFLLHAQVDILNGNSTAIRLL